MKIHDISVPISEEMPVYPGDARVSITANTRIARGDFANTSQLSLGTHTGTHIDPPYHFVPDSTTVDEIEMERLIGPATVYDLGDVNSITAADLATLKIPYPTERILFKTKSSSFWEDGAAFRDDYSHISPDGAQWLVDNGVRLVGVDYLSAERYDADEPLAHLILLKAEVIIVEGLNLTPIEPGMYTLICLPIKIKGGDGAPARAVLVQE